MWWTFVEHISLGFIKRLLLIKISGVDLFWIKNCINV